MAQHFLNQLGPDISQLQGILDQLQQAPSPFGNTQQPPNGLVEQMGQGVSPPVVFGGPRSGLLPPKVGSGTGGGGVKPGGPHQHR